MAKNKKNTATAVKTNNNTPIVQNITVQPPMRKSSDIMDWRNATRSAESNIPRRVYLYDLYHDISTTDGQVIAVWSKRQDAITTAKWEFTDHDGNSVDEINELIDCIGFENLLKEIIDSKAWGYAMCEATFFVNQNGQNEFSLYSIPKKHLRPEMGLVVKNQNDDTGININDAMYAKTVMQFGNTTDLGLFLSASMYAIYKRGDISDWAEFIEIFGRGIIDAEWDGFDESQRKNLARAIREMGSGGVLIRPSGTSVDVKNNTGNANGQLQDLFATKMDGYISKVLLGTTETTDSSKSSGYAQSETHSKQDEKKNNSDLQFVRRYLNTQFIKVLKAAGFDTKGGTFVLREDEKLDQDAFNIHKSMKLDLKVPIDDDFFYENYGVRKPENYDTLKNELSNTNQNTDNQTDNSNSNAPTPDSSGSKTDNNPAVPKDKKGKSPDTSGNENNTQLTWFRRLLRLFQSAPAVALPTAGATQRACCGSHHTNVKLAKFVSDKVFEQIKVDLIQKAWESKGTLNFHADLFYYTANTLCDAFSLGWHTKPTKLVDLGFTYDVDDPATLTAYEMNLFRFAGAKTLYEAQLLNEIFRSAGGDFKAFHDSVESILDIHNSAWLETEYNTALAVGEMAATYSRFLKQTDIFPYWQYKTINDNRVRHAHQLLDGVALHWNNSAWDTIFPPNDWNCRCYVVPRTKEEVTAEMLKESEDKVSAYFSSDGFKNSKKAGFAVNRVKKQTVFAENQMYTKNYLSARKEMNALNYKSWGLKPFEDNFTDLEISPKFTATQKDEAIADFLNGLNKVTAKKYSINDYKNRQITIDKSTLRKHTTSRLDKYKERHVLLSDLPTVIQQPDEVWLQNYSDLYDCYVYIKYYNDTAIYVVCTLEENLGLKIETWYKFGEAHADGRNGLLVYNRKSR